MSTPFRSAFQNFRGVDTSVAFTVLLCDFKILHYLFPMRITEVDAKGCQEVSFAIPIYIPYNKLKVVSLNLLQLHFL